MPWLLTDVEWMRSRLHAGGVTGLLTDYTTVPDQPGLALVHATIRLSAHVLAVDPDQLPTSSPGERSDDASRNWLALMRQCGRGRTQPGYARSSPLWHSRARRSGKPSPATTARCGGWR